MPRISAVSAPDALASGVQKENGSLVFRSDCNSMFGKKYYNYPELYEVERDAMNCVIKKFAKEFKLKKRK